MDDRITPENTPQADQSNQQQPAQDPAVVTTDPTQPAPPAEDAITQTETISMDTPGEVPPLPEETQPRVVAPVSAPLDKQGITYVDPATIANDRSDQYFQAQAEAKKHRMRESLDKQPKVRTMVPLEPGEKSPAWQYVALNGYPLWIKKGVFVDVPEQVAQIIAESYQLTYAAGEDKLVDARDDRSDALR